MSVPVACDKKRERVGWMGIEGRESMSIPVARDKKRERVGWMGIKGREREGGIFTIKGESAIVMVH
jgi:hypothetical protein